MINEMVDIIVGVNSPEKIILFGSCARGDNNNGSDVDFLIIDNKQYGNDNVRLSEIDRIHSALWKFIVPIDILLFTSDEVEYWKHSVSSIVSHSLKEGKVLYERS